jgi:group I intron endonuclease
MADSHPTAPKPYGRIYLVRNTANGKLYIGQTRKQLSIRWTQHVSDAKHHTGCKFIARAIRKYRREAFEVSEIAVAYNQPDLDNLEACWIIALQTYKPEIGYNRTIGGRGCPAVDEVRSKISAAALAQWSDPDRRAKAIAGMKAASAERLSRWTPEERKAKMSRDVKGEKNPAFGKPGTRLGTTWSAETRKRMESAIARRKEERRKEDFIRGITSGNLF